jgi:hypothetical protein
LRAIGNAKGGGMNWLERLLERIFGDKKKEEEKLERERKRKWEPYKKYEVHPDRRVRWYNDD